MIYILMDQCRELEFGNGHGQRERQRGKGIDITRQDTNDEKIKPMDIKENDINE